jgi:EAL domain-containing protein (putative c-di-GMP-specific phosphodiesterase class I)
VREAADGIGGFTVATCGAREAVIRLAGAAERYSHVLVQPGSAEGWLAELADLSSVGGSVSAMLLLGEERPALPRLRVIRIADAAAVRAALRPRTTAPTASGSRMLPIELAQALNGATIETRYQPIVRLSDRQPIALEALARLNHPHEGTLLPDDFVPQMEDAGLAAQLTDLVASRAFADMQGPVGGLGLLLSLNFPLDVMLVPAALARLKDCREAAGIAADRVVIELTESRPVDNLPALRRSVERLRADGYRVSIDDVAPSLPHLAKLLELPFTSVKLDKDLVWQTDRQEFADFVGLLAQRAHDRGMLVIAEGVEDAALWARIAALGADYAQGFFVARPLPGTAVGLWHEAWTSVSSDG